MVEPRKAAGPMSSELSNLLIELIGVWLWLSPLWIWQLAHLMSRDEREFNSPGDKTRWIIILVAAPIFGVLAFTLWRIASPKRAVSSDIVRIGMLNWIRLARPGARS